MTVAHNLPLELTSFVGRRTQTAEVVRLLSTTRLLSLTGTAGVGKTRLAQRAAADAASAYPDGVWLVELAGIADSTLLAQTVGAVFGIRERPRQPLLDKLLKALVAKQALVLLDNCEHLLPACAELAATLLMTCPHVSMLVTSREALNIGGEVCWRVPSLSIPESPQSVSELLMCDAVRLYVDRARAVLPGFNVTDRNAPAVAGICRRLDGLPLAIELAASRAKVLSVEEIATRLGDRFQLLTAGSRAAPTRQQTLRAAIDWSYGLLTEEERTVFERLSVFAGGWTVEAAEAIVVGDGITRGDVLDILARLAGKSLIVVDQAEGGPARHHLLETLRQYARERLVEHVGSETTAGRHAEHYIDFAERVRADFFGPREHLALHRLQIEMENVRAALARLISQGSVGHAQRLGAVMGMFCFFKSYLTEGRNWLEQVLAMPGTDAPTPGRAYCLFAASDLALERGDHAEAKRYAQDSLVLWQALENEREAAAAQYMLGYTSRMLGDWASAVELLDHAVSAAEMAGNTAYQALGLVALADIATTQRDYARARAEAEQARALAAEIGWTRVVAHALRSLADIAFEEGDNGAARAYAEEAVAKIREHIAAPWWLAWSLTSLGHVSTAQHDFATARSALGDALSLGQEIGDSQGIARALEAFAYLAWAKGNPESAACLAAAADVGRDSAGGTVSSPSWRARDELKSALSSLAPDILESAARKGRSMSIQEAVEYAVAAGQQTIERAGASDPFSPREREVVALVAQGLSNLEIAQRLVLSERTVESHVRNALRKLGMPSRVGLAAWAVQRHLVPKPTEH